MTLRKIIICLFALLLPTGCSLLLNNFRSNYELQLEKIIKNTPSKINVHHNNGVIYFNYFNKRAKLHTIQKELIKILKKNKLHVINYKLGDNFFSVSAVLAV